MKPVLGTRFPESLELRIVFSNPGFEMHLIAEFGTSFHGQVRDLAVGDFDNDADIDVVAATGQELILFRNERDGDELIFEAKALDGSTSVDSVVVVDLDGDDTLDILVASHAESEVRWYRNSDGTGNFGLPELISNSPGGVASLAVADIDNDVDLDIIASVGSFDPVLRLLGDGVLTLFENEGAGTFSNPILFELRQTTFSAAVGDVAVGDLDGDEDVDIVTAFGWVENTDEGFVGVHPLAEAFLFDILLHDFDQDGVLDLVSPLESETPIWMQGIITDAGFAFTEPEPIASLANAYAATLADLDGDGREDLVLAGGNLLKPEPLLGWFKYDNGFAELHPFSFVANGLGSALASGDFDGDGDQDIVAGLIGQTGGGHSLAWYESDLIEATVSLVPGDADRNGQVNFADFLILSSNFGTAGDASWTDGDFDGDRQVSFSDFLILSANFGNPARS